jgi:hypothetical protein
MKYRVAVPFLLLMASVAPITAAPMIFIASLDGPSEAPPNASPGTGFTTVTIDPVAHTLQVTVDYANLVAPVTASHIHGLDAPGDTILGDLLGPVLTTTPTFPGFPTSTSGHYAGSFDLTLASSFRPGFITAAGGIPQAEVALLEAIVSGKAYLNIHSSTYPGGEIRGFLEPVPEPATMGIAFAAFAALGILRRVKKGRIA